MKLFFLPILVLTILDTFSAQVTTNFDRELFEICLGCWFETIGIQDRSDMPEPNCQGSFSSDNPYGYSCGPFSITLPYWEKGNSPRVNSSYSNITSLELKLKALEACGNSPTCLNETIYGNIQTKHCDENGKFDCADVLRIHYNGFMNCRNNLSTGHQDILQGTYSCYLRKISANSGVPLTAVLIPLVVVIVVSVIGVYSFWRYRRAKISEDRATKRVLKSNNDPAAVNLPLSAIIPPDELIIDKDKCLGEGQFGMVYGGTYKDISVAIKAPKLALGGVGELEKELETMIKVGVHPNVVRFFGAEISQIRRGIAYVVLELSPHGALLDHLRGLFLQEISGVSDNKQKSILPYETKVYWAEQIALGMGFLEQQKVMHGDLAARNILLFDCSIVKISDFGFARNLGNYEEYEKQVGLMPWRWMALESLERRLFSPKSDVWSYGVTVWEIFTLGIVPYAESEGCTTDFITGIRTGTRLPQPESMSEEIYELLLKCWTIFPDQRPTFENLASLFRDLRLKAFPDGTFFENEVDKDIESINDSQLAPHPLDVPRYVLN